MVADHIHVVARARRRLPPARILGCVPSILSSMACPVDSVDFGRDPDRLELPHQRSRGPGKRGRWMHTFTMSPERIGIICAHCFHVDLIPDVSWPEICMYQAGLDRPTTRLQLMEVSWKDLLKPRRLQRLQFLIVWTTYPLFRFESLLHDKKCVSGSDSYDPINTGRGHVG